MLTLLWAMLAVVMVVVALPLVVYLTVKLAVVAWHSGRRLADRMARDENRRDKHWPFF